jgi:hypothetical protein
MVNVLTIALLFISINAHSHVGDYGGSSSLEEQFSKTSDIHLPVIFSSLEGLTFGTQSGKYDQETSQGAQENDEQGANGDKTGLEFNVHPFIFIGSDKIIRFTSLEESVSNSRVLESPSASSPYIFMQNKKWNFGLGIEGEIHLPNPTFSKGIGIGYIRGKSYYTKQLLSSRHEQRPPLRLPVTRKALLNWRKGDELFYAARGSIIFNIVLGMGPIVQFGPAYAHTGTFRYKIRRKDQNTMEVEVMALESDSFSVGAGAIILDADTGKTRGFSKTIIYDFDLGSDESLKSIEHLLKGRLDLVNESLLYAGGTIQLKTELFNKNVFASASVRVPYFYSNIGNRGTYHNFGTIEGKNNKANVYSTTEVKENYTKGRLTQRKYENQSVVSTVVTGENSILSSVLTWSLSLEKAKAHKLQKRFNKLSKTFNIPKLMNLQFPQEELGFIKANFALNLSGREVLDLLNKRELALIKTSALSNLENDFRTFGHRSFCKVRNYSNCLKRYKNLIENKTLFITGLRSRIENSYKKNHLTSVTHDLTKVTQTLFSSKYLTEAFMRGNKGVIRELRLEGEKIKKHTFSSAQSTL